MIYGTSNVHVVRDVTDLIGIRTLILRQYWQATSTNPSQAELDAMQPAAPSVPGGMRIMGAQTMKERGRYGTMWTFQGINGDGSSVTFKNRGNSIDYGFEPGFAQVPIQVHKKFTALLDKYQGYPSNDGTTVIWPPELSSGKAAGASALQITAPSGAVIGAGTPAMNAAWEAASGNTNPMFGIQSFFEMEGIYRYRYAEIQLPSGIMNGVGRIAGGLPGNPPPLSDGRNWLKAPTAYALKGYVFDITEYYWLSRRGGWPIPVYS